MAAANTGKLAGRTIFISGASRGIGKAIALKCAKDGANIVIAAKTATPHAKLPGTIYTAAKEIEDAGGKCLPCIVDIRSEEQVEKSMKEAVGKFGGIDILVNNASAISLTGTDYTSMKKYDLMNGVNARGTYLCSKYALPFLKKGTNPHILNISPPLNMNPKWFKDHVAYTMAKYGMSMCVLGMSHEFKDDGIAVNALWPRTAIYTAAMEMLGGGDGVKDQCRSSDIMSDAAYVMLTKNSKSYTGNFAIDDDVLKEVGMSDADLDKYAMVPGSTLMPDFFLDGVDPDKIVDQMKEAGLTPKFEKQSAPSGGNPKVLETFKVVESMLNKDLVSSTKGVFAFDIKDEGLHYIDLKNGDGAVGQGPPPTEADCTMILNSDNFVKMFQGKLGSTQAFMTGKLKIKGDLGKAMKLEKLMKQMKSKL